MVLSMIFTYIVELLQLIIIKILVITLQILALPFELLSLSYQYFVFKPKIFKSILITGASSGIGLQFALDIASQKHTQRLVLIARRLDKLKKAQQQCITNGCNNVEIYSCDVTDKNKMKQIIEECDNKKPLDLVFANAGYRSDLHHDIISSAYKTFDVNINGVLNTILPIIPRMINRKQGQIIINASIAGLTPHKLFPFYSASKHALMSLAENLRCTLHEYNIGVTVTLPGFVETELVTHLTDSKLPMIGKISVSNATQNIKHAAKYNYAICGFPFLSNILGFLYETVSPRFKQIILDYNIIDRIIGWYNVVPNRKWLND
eukprot:207120_1